MKESLAGIIHWSCVVVARKRLIPTTECDGILASEPKTKKPVKMVSLYQIKPPYYRSPQLLLHQVVTSFIEYFHFTLDLPFTLVFTAACTTFHFLTGPLLAPHMKLLPFTTT